MKKILFCLIFSLIYSALAVAQISITTSSSYFQDFNTLPNYGTSVAWTNNGTLANWYANQSNPPLGVIRIGSGGSTTGGLYSFGITPDSTDRALGSLCSGTPGAIAYGVLLQNNSGATVTDMTVCYVGEQWRKGGETTADTLKFYYRISSTGITDPEPGTDSLWTAVSALDFLSPINTASGSALDGNSNPNRTTINTVAIPGLTLADGEYVMLRWKDIDDASSDQGLSLDSLTITWTVGSSNTITTGTITGSPFSVTGSTGAAVDVPYTVTGSYNAGNNFKAYLSNASGSFASEVEIGSLAAQSDSTISATIPAGTPSGTGYRIRVKSDDPIAVGTNNGADLEVILTIVDITPPTVLDAYATDLSTVIVIFDELLDQTSAETTGNYTFTGSAVTGGAILGTGMDTVVLTLSTPLVSGVADTLTVANISDTALNAMILSYDFEILYATPAQWDTIVWWNFPNSVDDTLADGGIPANLNSIISRELTFAGSYSYLTGATSYCISTTSWDAGAYSKFWGVLFNTQLYDSIKVSSKQRSSSTGPLDFALEYSLDGFIWTPLTTITTAANWTTGAVTNVALPDVCNNQSSVLLRWVMTTDSAVGGGAVLAAGTSRIDDIYVTGRYNPSLGTLCNTIGEEMPFTIYPNPADENVTLNFGKKTEATINIYSYTGAEVISEIVSGEKAIINISDLPVGIYVISAIEKGTNNKSIGKLIVK